jgi:hypothetical protein
MRSFPTVLALAVVAITASASDGNLKAPACLGESRPAPFHDFSDVLGAEYTPAIAGGDRFWVGALSLDGSRDANRNWAISHSLPAVTT